MRPLLLLLFTFFTAGVPALAQQRLYTAYSWEEARKPMPLDEEEQRLGVLMLKDFQGIQYLFDSEGNLSMYSLSHKIYRVNSNEAIERYNKVYIPFREGSEVVKIHARVVNPNGEIIVLDSSSVKSMQDEETGMQFQMFAMEGVELGSEIEYVYLMKSYGQSTLFGERKYFQYSIPARNVEFELISPTNLEFVCRGYNGFPQTTQEVAGKQRIHKAAIDQVKAMREESFAMYHSNRMRMEFKLRYNHAGNTGELYTWSDAGSRIFDNLKVTDKEDQKVVKGLYKSLKINKKGFEGKIRGIENYLKSNITIRLGYSPEYVDIRAILANKYANENGIIRLYTALFDQAGIEYEIVLTSNRDQARFDASFQSWKYLANYAFYFPKTQSYLPPTIPDMRYGMLPYYWTAQDGLFIKGVEAGKYTIGVGRTRYIEPLSYDQSADSLTISLKFSDDMSEASFSLTSLTRGYNAAAIQPYYPFIPENRRKDILSEVAGQYLRGANFEELYAINGEKDLSPLVSPFMVKATGTISSILEKAGPKYLLKIGELIGAQVEMYQEYERQNEIENDFNRWYSRKIIIELPAQYKIKNLSDLTMDIFHEEEGNRIYAFETSYIQEGNRVEVTIKEYYKKIRCDIQHFEPFKAVVNAAADFNKVVLVIE